MTHLSPATAGGSLRERFIADMTVRGFTDKTCKDYLRTVAGFAAFLDRSPGTATAEDIQNVVYEIGRREPFLDTVKKGKDGRPGVSLEWFNMLYQVLLGQEKGPRFGSFVAVYGLGNTIDMIDGALARSA